MRRVLVYLILLGGGAYALFQARGLLEPRLGAGEASLEGEEVATVFPSARWGNTIRMSASWLGLDSEDGDRTERLDYVLAFESLKIDPGGKLHLVEPRLRVHRQPERAVVTELAARRGLVEEGMKSVLFWDDVVVDSTDGATRSRLETDRIWCHFEERRVRSEEALRFASGAGDADPDLVATGIGLTADLGLGKIEIDREGRIDLVPRGGRFGAPLPGWRRPEGDPGEKIHLECRGELLVERVAKDGSAGTESCRVTLRDHPVVVRGGSTLSARQVVHFVVGYSPDADGARSLALDEVRAVEGVALIDVREDGRSEATGDHFVWKRLPDGSEEAVLRYEPRLSFLGTDFGTGENDEVLSRTTIACRGDMTFLRREPPARDGEVRLAATFAGDVVARRVEVDPAGGDLPGSEEVLASDRLELEIEPGGQARRVRTVRATGRVRFAGADLEAGGDLLVRERPVPTESVLTLSGGAPWLTLRDAELRITCRDRMVYTRRTGTPDPDDGFEAVGGVHIEKIPRADPGGRATLNAEKMVALVLAARPAGELGVRRLEALEAVRFVEADAGATADRLVYEADGPESETADLSGRARAWSSDGFVEGEGIHCRRERSAEGFATADEAVVHGAPGRPAVVWRPVDLPAPGAVPDPEIPPADRHHIQAEEAISYDRLARRAVATGRAFCRIYEGGDRRTPWVVKALRIEATFAPEDEDGRISVERLAGSEEVHIYSVPAEGEPREARGHAFEYLALERAGRLAADPSDPNDRVQVWRGEDWIRSREIDFADSPDGGAWTEGGGLVHLVPDRQAVALGAPARPVEIECRGAIRFDRGADRIRFERDVRVVQGAAEFRARVLEAFLDPQTRRVQRAVGTGEVLLTMEENSGHGDRVEWDVPGRRGILTGTPQARVRSGEGDWVSGDRIVYELDGERVTVDGHPMGEYEPGRDH